MRVELYVLIVASISQWSFVESTLKEEDEKFSKLFMDSISPKQIEKYLFDLAHKVHRAGTQEGLDVAEYIRSRFQEFGLSPVEVDDYDVMLSYPNDDQPDEVALLDTDGNEVIISNGRSPILEDSESVSKNADLRFLAFGKAGTAISKTLIYANYGRLDDFRYLMDQGIPLNGSVVLIRYGYTWRGTKVRLAQDFGATGVLLYSDPYDFHGLERMAPNDTFPHNDHLPENDVQRGTVVAEDNGDILTPLLPAKDYVTRRTVDSILEQRKLPGIPATVIGFADAQRLLQEMEGIRAPQAWQGMLPLDYNVGGKFKSAAQIKVTVTGHLERKKIRNVIGYIKGSTEPDRYVILGNHHDAWTYGALDPSSGTAALLETARAFGRMIKENNWQPRRTLVFCAWDGEEYGLIGSTEWVEHNLARLQSQAIAYINVDTAVTGQYAIFARGVPALKEVLFEAAKRVENPNEDERKAGLKSVYETWTKADHSSKSPAEPRVDTVVGSGSDYKPFLHYAGVPVMDLRYASFDRSYPLYHTLHDTVFMVKQYVDPKFSYHQAVARLWGEYARLLSESPLIPLNGEDSSKDLLERFAEFQKYLSGTQFAFSVDLAPIEKGLEAFKQATHTFASKARSLSSDLVWSSDIEKRFSEVQFINHRLLMLERFFLIPGGTPHRPSTRHTLYGPGITDSYSGVVFPGVQAALHYSNSKNMDFDKDSDHAQIVGEQISWVAACLHSAADWLNREF